MSNLHSETFWKGKINYEGTNKELVNEILAESIKEEGRERAFVVNSYKKSI